jgi:hypothetical protein
VDTVHRVEVSRSTSARPRSPLPALAWSLGVAAVALGVEQTAGLVGRAAAVVPVSLIVLGAAAAARHARERARRRRSVHAALEVD